MTVCPRGISKIRTRQQEGVGGGGVPYGKVRYQKLKSVEAYAYGQSARAARACVLCSGECALQGWAPVCKQAKCVLYARAPTHPASEKHSDAKNEGAATAVD